MAAYIITYDLRTPGKDYQSLISAIKSYPQACKPTESTWIIKSDEKPITIHDSLKRYMDSNDRLFVAVLTGSAAWTNSISGTDAIRAALT